MTNPDLVRRLAVIRRLYQAGEQQSASSLPHSAFSVLSFHDCVEWFLITASVHLKVEPGRRPTVHNYYDSCAKTSKIGGALFLNKLVSARNELKHRFHLPSQETIRDLRSLTAHFLAENTMNSVRYKL